jgi:hypothetical protein
VGFRGHQGGWGNQVFLEVFEGFLFSPLDIFLFFVELEERGSPDAES